MMEWRETLHEPLNLSLMVTNDRRSEVTTPVKKRKDVKLLISGRSFVKLVSITTAVFLAVSTSLVAIDRINIPRSTEKCLRNS